MPGFMCSIFRLGFVCERTCGSTARTCIRFVHFCVRAVGCIQVYVWVDVLDLFSYCFTVVFLNTLANSCLGLGLVGEGACAYL